MSRIESLFSKRPRTTPDPMEWLCNRKPTRGPILGKFWWILVLLTWMLRLGEAAHPGPRAHHSGPIIGCMNPTGMLGKSHLIAELPRGSESIWAVSESHLTKHGKQKCTEELRYHEAGYH